MRRELLITESPIDEPALLQHRRSVEETGAAVSFSGIVRRTEGSSSITAIRYEAFQAMAEHQFNKIFDDVQRRWPVQSIRLVHRIGVVAVGEPSLWVEVIAAHRGEAFAACQFLIDEMKRLVPIWKHPIIAATLHPFEP